MTLKQPSAQSYSKRLEAVAAGALAIGLLSALGLVGWLVSP